MEPPTVALEQRPPAVAADRVADQRTDEVADRSREGDHEKGGHPPAELVAEERHVTFRDERAGRERAPVEHHDLARSREHGVDHHQEEDGVHAVRGDLRGECRGDAGEHADAESMTDAR